MLGPIRSTVYHPTVLLAEKRRLRFANNLSGESQGLSEIKVSTPDGEPVQLTGQAKPIQDAQSFLDQAREEFKKISEKYEEMRKLVHSATDPKLDDLDRKKLNNQLQALRLTYDKSVKGTDIGGVKLFSGETIKAPKRFSLEEDENKTDRSESLVDVVGRKTIDFRVDSVSSEGLKVDRYKIDSLVNARKASQFYEIGKTRLAELGGNFKSKQDAINFQVSKLPRDEENEKKLPSSGGMGSTSSKNEPPMNPWKRQELSQLRLLQKELAESTDETHGLLIETKA